MTTHAILGASSAHRWMACPGSVALTQGMRDSGSAYAAEGTLAHELAELCLRHNIQATDLPNDTDWGRYPQDMREHVQTYLDYVRSRAAQTGGRLLIEQRVDYSTWVPQGFGTADAVILAPGRIITIDLKYGQGVRVNAQGNPQARLYALGAYSDYWFELDEVTESESVIVQPRLDHIDEYIEPMSDLLAFAETARAAALKALSPAAPLVPGASQCRFCLARATCRARAEQSLAVAMQEFDEPTPAPGRLSLEEIGALLPKLDGIAQWIKDVTDYALQQALEGNAIAGHKLVAGRSVRRWSPDALEALAGHPKASELFEQKLVGIGQAEKVLGKKAPELEALTEKPEGRPVLVASSDKRPEIQGATTAAQDFSD